MKNILCIFPPFCSPVSPPYSITYVAGFLKRNTKEFDFSLFDLNAWLHHEEYKEDYKKIKSYLQLAKTDEYASAIHKINLEMAAFSKKENNLLRTENKSSLLQKCLDEILRKKPDIVLMSLVYNSQAFFSLLLAKQLKEIGIEVIVGGPAVTAQLKEAATYLPNEVALLEHITKKQSNHNSLDCERILDYSGYDFSLYFTPEPVISLRTSSCCYYQKCAFCTHHGFGKYIEYDLDDIKKSIVMSNAKLVFVIDDMIHKKRLLELAGIMKPLGVHWMCQLRPTKDLDFETLKILHDSGLQIIIWGVESASDRVLALIEKGTNAKDVAVVLKSGKEAGIINVTYILFGFPTETKEEFIETINFLKDNRQFIDLVSTSVFGLQEGSLVEKNPAKYSITDVQREKRAMLPDKLTYSVSSGLHKDDAREMKQNYSKTLSSINKFPKEMNIYREHMLFAALHNGKL